jgi:WD40 repeat protein
MSNPASTRSASSGSKVFISYSRKDSAFAGTLLAKLNSRGFEAYLDSKDILPGEPWQERLAELIRIADTVVFIISPNAIASKVCAWEVEESLRVGKRILPVVLRRTEHGVPQSLQRLNYIFFDNGGLFSRRRAFNAALEQLTRALDTDIGWIREHTRLGELARRWRESGEPSSAILRGDAIAAAEQWLVLAPMSREVPPELGLHRSFIAASRETFEKEEEEKQRNIDRFLISQSRFLADRANQQIDAGDTVTGMAIAVEGLAHDDGPFARPFVIDAAAAVQRALTEQRELLVLKGHTHSIQTCHLSPDLSHVFTASDDSTTRKWCAKTGEELWSRPIQHATFDFKKAIVVGVENDRLLNVYALSSGDLIRQIETDLYNFVRPGIDPTGELLAWLGEDAGTAFIWEIATGRARELPGRGDIIEQIVFSRNPLSQPVGRLAATLERNGVVIVWDLSTGTVRTVIESGVERPNAICFNLFGTKIAVAGETGHVKQFDLKSSETLAEFAIQDCPIRHVEFAGNTSLMTSVGSISNGHHSVEAVRILDSESGKTRCSIGAHDEAIISARFGALGQVITTSWDGTARIWNQFTGEQLDTLRGHDEGVTCADVSVDGNCIVTGSHDQTVRVWNLKTARRRASTKPANDYTAVAYNDSGGLIAERTSQFDVRIYEVQTRKEISHLSGGVPYVSHDTRFSPDGRLILAGGGEVWDVATGRHLYALQGHDGPIQCRRFNADGRLIVTTGLDGTVRVWNAATGTCGLVIPVLDEECITSAAFDADSRRLVSTHRKGMAQLWDATSGKELLAIGLDGLEVLDAAFSPDGKMLATASGKRAEIGSRFCVDIWSTVDGTRRLSMHGHELEPVQVVFSSMGNYVVSVGWDRVIRVWSAQSGLELGRLPALDDPKVPMIAAEHADQKGLDLTVHAASRAERYVWPIILDRISLVAAARRRLPRALLRNQRDQHFLDPEPPRWCVELKKWPYHTEAWQQWLDDTKAGRAAQMPSAESRWLRV